MKINLLCSIIGISALLQTNAQQSEYPKVGQSVRDYNFSDVHKFGKAEVSLKDLRGKWVLLDFWNNGCISCIKDFPNWNKLVKEFKNKAVLLSVGMIDERSRLFNTAKTMQTYSFHEKKYNLTFPIAFDNGAVEAFDIQGTPTQILIDPNGIIRAKGNGIDSAYLAAYIQGSIPSSSIHYVFSKHESSEPGYKTQTPLLTNGGIDNGGISDTSFSYRSMILPWNEIITPRYRIYKGLQGNWQDSMQKGVFELIGYDLPSLIRIAYTGADEWSYSLSDAGPLGNISNRLIVENSDPGKFIGRILPDKGLSEEHKKRLYCYSLKLPKGQANIEKFKKYLLQDLERYFGFTSTFELRKVEAFKLIVTDRSKVEKLKAKPGTEVKYIYDKTTREGLRVRNRPLSFITLDQDVASAIRRKFYVKPGQDYFDYAPKIVDETGITFNVDMDLNDDIVNFDVLQKILRANGLDLVKGQIEMMCIVVRDAK